MVIDGLLVVMGGLLVVMGGLLVVMGGGETMEGCDSRRNNVS